MNKTVRVALVALLGAFPHGAVDLVAREVGRQDAAGEVRQVARARGVVTFVRDGDYAGPETEGEQHLGRGWDKRCDAHGDENGTSE